MRLRDIDITSLRSDEVRVRVEATGVCHTDLSWAGGALFPRFPVVLGHETAGLVDAVGADVVGLAPGDRVVIALSQSCGHCRFCERGTPMLCDKSGKGRSRLSLNGQSVHQGFGVGGFAEHLVIEAHSAIKLPDDVPSQVAAVMGCAVSTGLGAVFNVADVEYGTSVLVLGAGAVGLSVVMGARLAGAHDVLVVDPSSERRRHALGLGATRVVADTVALGDERFPFVFEAVGRKETMEFAIAAAERGGAVTLIGAPPPDVEISFNALEFVPSQRRILGCQTGNVRPHVDFPRYFDLYRAGRLPLDALVTSTVPFDDLADGLVRAETLRGLRTVITF
jgi:Zn-dependent alcohol dehydrogenase